jgi:hypothetical protein
VLDAEASVTGRETIAAMQTVIISALQFHRTQSALHLLAATACIARQLAAWARQVRALPIGTISVETPLDDARGQSQSRPPCRRFQRFKVEFPETLAVNPRFELLPEISGQTVGDCGFF